MSWFQKASTPKINRREGDVKTTVPEGLWRKCDACQEVLYFEDLQKNFDVCPKCGHHHRLAARARINALLDADARFEIGAEVRPIDALKFQDSRKYSERLVSSQKSTGEDDALVVMQGTIKGMPIVVAAFDFSFMGGSMGSVVGERFVRGVQCALEQKCAFVCFAASGGARMQEGLLSLMQMAKTCAAITQLNEEKLPFISVLTDPTMGGVSASFAFMGDIVIAEPNALIGFAGARVIQQTVRETLPEGFQRAEFLLEHGAIDLIVDRRDMANQLVSLVSLLMCQSEPTVA